MKASYFFIYFIFLCIFNSIEVSWDLTNDNHQSGRKRKMKNIFRSLPDECHL